MSASCIKTKLFQKNHHHNIAWHSEVYLLIPFTWVVVCINECTISGYIGPISIHQIELKWSDYLKLNRSVRKYVLSLANTQDLIVMLVKSLNSAKNVLPWKTICPGMWRSINFSFSFTFPGCQYRVWGVYAVASKADLTMIIFMNFPADTTDYVKQKTF